MVDMYMPNIEQLEYFARHSPLCFSGSPEGKAKKNALAGFGYTQLDNSQ